MTKHIIGLIIFTLIVGTSVVAVGLFGYSPAPKPIYCTKYQPEHQVNRNRKPIPTDFETALTQATFDRKTNTLTANLSVANGVSTREVDLHFFVNDEFGTQYLRKETILVSSNKNLYENSFAWLNRLESRKNLYVMAVTKQESRNINYQPRFESSLATPVLLQSKE